MNCEHFIYGSFNSSGYKLYASSGVKTLLKPESLSMLCGLKLKQGKQEDTIQLHFPTEDAITFTHLQLDSDNFGRVVVINRTIIMQVQEILKDYPDLVGILYRMVEKDLVKPVTDIPRSLEPLVVKK